MAPRKNKKRSRAKAVIPRATISNTFPMEKVVKLKYVDYFTLTSTAGVLAKWQFRANSIHDPSYTAGIGDHQPYLHDNFELLYNHYKVISSNISVQFCTATTTDAGIPVIAGIYASDDLAVPDNYIDMMEGSRGTHKIMPRYNVQRPPSIKSSYNGKKALGDQYNTANNIGIMGGAGVGSNPSEQQFFNVWMQPLDGLTTTYPVSCVATLEYTVSLSERKDIARS